MLTFANQNFLLLSLTVFLWAGLLFYIRKSKSKKSNSVSENKNAKLLLNQIPQNRLLLNFLFSILIYLCFYFALARPQYGFDWQIVPQNGRNIFLVVDSSLSMLSQDIQPSRIERVKREIHDLLQSANSFDKIGLIGFAGNAFLVCPLTTDYETLESFLDDLDPDPSIKQGSNIYDALRLALLSFERVTKDHTPSNAIVLISDGETDDQKVDAMLTEVKNKNIPIYSIAVGTREGGPIALEEGGFKKDRSGNLVISKVNEEFLLKISSATEGALGKLDSSAFELNDWYKNIVQSKTKQATQDEVQEKIYHERYQWIGAFLLLSLFILTWMERASSLLLLLIILIVPMGFTKNVYADTDDQEIYNQAVRNFEEKKYDEAYEGFSRSLNSSDKSIRDNSLFNLGNTAIAKGNLEESQKAYEQLLDAEPQDKEAQENLAWVREQIQKKQEQQKQDEQKKDENKDENKQEEKKHEAKGQEQSQTHEQNSRQEKKQEFNMTQEQIERLLNSTEDHSKKLRLKSYLQEHREKDKNDSKPEQDW